MNSHLNDILAGLAAEEGRRAAASAPDPELEAGRLGRLIARRRAIRAGAVSCATVAVVAGVLTVANSLNLDSHDVPPIAPSPTTPSVRPTPEVSPDAPEPTTPLPAPEPEPTQDVPAPPDAEPTSPVHLPPGTIAITLTDNLRMRSQPSTGEGSTVISELSEGTELRVLRGPVPGSGHWWYEVTSTPETLHVEVRNAGWVAAAASDGTVWLGPAPLDCIDSEFPVTEPTVTSIADLRTGMIGTWRGCVRNPWQDPYEVTITFRSDGTYRATPWTRPDGSPAPAFEYGISGESPQQRYAIDHLLIGDYVTGIGVIDIVFFTDTINRDELRNISLMGDLLQFEFVHSGRSGPLTFRLHRLD